MIQSLCRVTLDRALTIMACIAMLGPDFTCQPGQPAVGFQPRFRDEGDESYQIQQEEGAGHVAALPNAVPQFWAGRAMEPYHCH